MREMNDLLIRDWYKSCRATWRYAWPKVWAAGRHHCAVIALALVLAAGTAPLSAIVLGQLVGRIKDLVTAPEAPGATLVPLILLAGLLVMVDLVCSVAAKYSRFRLRDDLQKNMRQEVFSHVGAIGLAQIEDTEVQDVVNRAGEKPGLSMINFVDGLLRAGSMCLRIGGLLGVMFWVSPFWSTVLLCLGVPFIVSKRYLAKAQFVLQRSKTKRRRFVQYYSSCLTNRESYPTVRMLELAPLLLQRFRDGMDDINRANRKFYRMQAAAVLGAGILSVVVLLTAIYFIAGDVAAGKLGIVKFTAFWAAAWRLQSALTSLGEAFYVVSDAEYQIRNVRELFALPALEVGTGGGFVPAGLQGRIELDDISFTYRGADQPALSHVSLQIEPAETVAIVGPNGAGKSTLAKLLVGLYQPDSGRVLMDDREITDYDLGALQARMALVPQRTVRFEATARDNLAFGDWDRLAAAPERVREVAVAAGIDGLISGLPDGYDTLLGRRFGRHDLSGGQWQKLAIARSLAREPDLVILDEPVANLDVQAEYELYKSIRTLIKDRTTILISHRFSTVRMADRIFVLLDGELVEQGSYSDLIQQGGTFAAMCRTYEAMLGLDRGHDSQEDAALDE